MPGVFRHGRGQYSDNASGMGFTSVPGSGGQGSPVGKTVEQAQREGLVGERVGYNPAYDQRLNGATGISAQNMGAADALASREYAASMGRLMASGQIQAPGAGPSFIMQSNTGFRRDPRLVAPEDAARRTLRYAQGDDPASRERKAKFQTAQLEQQGLAQRNQATNDIAQKELALKTEAQGFTTRAAQQLEGLQNQYAAETDPAKQSALARQIREVQGKEQPARYKVAAGGQQIYANGVAYKVPDRVFNEQTGQFSDGTGAAPTPAAAPKAGETRNGYRFKGGNPNDQANWAKV